MVDTNIFERVCSEVIFLLIAIIVLYLISKTNNYKKIGIYLLFYVIVLCVMSFSFTPTIELDLQRIQRDIASGYNFSLGKLFELLPNTSDYTKLIYYYIIKQIGVPNLLQTIVTFIVYSIIFYTVYDYSKRNSLNGLAVARTVFLFMMFGQYIDLISGIRSTTAFALFYFCIYREFIQEKNILSDLLIYIIAIGFHNAVVPAIVVRLVFLILTKERKIWKKILNFIILVALVFLSFKYGTAIISSTYTRANSYLSNNGYSSIYGYIVSSLVLCVCIFLYHLNHKKMKQEKLIDLNYKNYVKFSSLYFFVVFLFCYEYNIFHRYVILLSMLMIPIAMQSFTLLNEKNNTRKLVMSKNNFVYYLLLLVMALMSFSKGEMSLLQFFK